MKQWAADFDKRLADKEDALFRQGAIAMWDGPVKRMSTLKIINRALTFISQYTEPSAHVIDSQPHDNTPGPSPAQG